MTPCSAGDGLMTSPFANMSREIFQYDECDQQQQCSVLQQLELQQDSLYSKLRSGQEAAASCDHKQQIKSDDWTSSGRRHCLDTMGTMHTSSSRCDSGVSILTLCTCLGSGSLGHKVFLAELPDGQQVAVKTSSAFFPLQRHPCWDTIAASQLHPPTSAAGTSHTSPMPSCSTTPSAGSPSDSSVLSRFMCQQQQQQQQQRLTVAIGSWPQVAGSPQCCELLGQHAILRAFSFSDTVIGGTQAVAEQFSIDMRMGSDEWCSDASCSGCSSAGDLEHEAAIAALLAAHPHPNIVRYLGTAQLEGGFDAGGCGSTALVMELCGGGTLLKLIHAAHRAGRAGSTAHGPVQHSAHHARQAAGMRPCGRDTAGCAAHASLARRFFGSWRLRVDVLRGLARGLAHMHALGVVHGDVTSYNVLVGKGCEPKLCDFDRAHATRGPIARTGPPHSLLWQPAEHVLGSAPYDGMAADVHCFGIVVFEVVTLCVPHTTREDEAHEWSPHQLAAHTAGRLCEQQHPPHQDPLEHMPHSPEQLWPHLPANLPADVQARVVSDLVMLARMCCDPLPAARPAISEVVTQLDLVAQLLMAAAASS